MMERLDLGDVVFRAEGDGVYVVSYDVGAQPLSREDLEKLHDWLTAYLSGNGDLL